MSEENEEDRSTERQNRLLVHIGKKFSYLLSIAWIAQPLQSNADSSISQVSLGPNGCYIATFKFYSVGFF